MSVFQKITLQSLKRNRTRTIVTIIGVILSVALATAVTTSIYSFQQFMIQHAITRSGDWHMRVSGADAAQIEELRASGEVAASALTQDTGYALLGDSQNEQKPYLILKGFSDEAFGMLPLILLSGRMPEAPDEILLPKDLQATGGIEYGLGDTLFLDIGDEITYNEDTGFIESDADPAVLNIHRSARYTVVGFIDPPTFLGYLPGYTAVTLVDKAAEAPLSLYLRLQTPSRAFALGGEITAGTSAEVSYNNDLLRYQGISNNGGYNTVLYGLGAILILLIGVGSVLLIYNSFSISVNERTRQFGILSSVGATRRQLARSVLFEGLCIGVIGIPAGLVLGILGIGATLLLTREQFAQLTTMGTEMQLSIAWGPLLIAAAVGAATIFISAYIPARRASRLSAIEAIRQSTTIKLTKKQVRTSRLTRRLFGLEGTLALKNFKRNRASYRGTVVALFVSIVLFITASAYGGYLRQSSENALQDYSFDISYYSWDTTDDEAIALYDKMRAVEGVTASGWYKVYYAPADFPRDALSRRYTEANYLPDMPAGQLEYSDTAYVYTLDDATFERYINALGLDLAEYTRRDSPGIVATQTVNGYDTVNERYEVYDVFDGKDPVTIPLGKATADGPPVFSGQELTITHFAGEMPDTFSETRGMGLRIYLPRSLAAQLLPPDTDSSPVELTFLSDTPAETAERMGKLLEEEELPTDGLFNVADAQERNRSILLIIDVFTYGFIVLISLVTIANIFNTVSTNIHLRRRELAMLQSIGMTEKGFSRMMRFECAFYGLKALLYGLPVAIFLTWLIYRAVVAGVDVPFTLPLPSIAISVFSVFFIVFVTMIYAVHKLRRENIIDSLRTETI